MAEVYTMELKNASDKPWYISVYQAFPNHRRLESLAWNVATLPPQLVYDLPSKKKIQWEIKYGVCLANYNEEERKFTPIQVTPAILGWQYEVVSDTNGDPMISKNPVEPVRSDLIVLKNNTSNPVQTLNLGFVMDNNIVAVERNVGGQLKVTYLAKSTYYIACHNNIVPGQQVDTCAVLKPMKLEFIRGSYTHSIVVQKDPEGNYQLQSLEKEMWPLESVEVLRDEEIDGGRDFADMQISNETPVDPNFRKLNSLWPNDCSSVKVDHFLLALILICGLIIVIALLLIVILVLLVVYLLTLVCFFVIIV